MDLGLIEYMVPALVYYIPYWSMYILAGISIASIQELMQHKVNKNGKSRLYMNIIANIHDVWVMLHLLTY